MPPITIQQLLQQAQQKIDALDAELILAHILNKPREWILANQKAKVQKSKVRKVQKYFAKRAKGAPLAYLTGHKEFFGLDFFVNKNVLIPRPDTETLVSLVLDQLKTEDLRLKIILIDVGTGSGCIPISIIETLKHKNIKTIVIDISNKALAVAKLNAKKHHVKIKFLHGDLLSPILKSSILNLKSSIVITANLPYLTHKQYQSSPSIHHEPRLALVANKNGLALYEKLLKQIHQLSYILHSTFYILLEIDPSQSRPITRLIKSTLPTAKIETIKDLAGRNRVVKIRVN